MKPDRNAGRRIAFALGGLIAGAGPLSAQNNLAGVGPGSPTENSGASGEKESQSVISNPLSGFGFGVGLTLTLDSGGSDRISEATVVDGVVRVTKEDNAQARFMLESHYFFTPNKRLFGRRCRIDRGENPNRVVTIDGTAKSVPARCGGVAPYDWGYGPFVAVLPGSENIVQAVGLGMMLGFRQKALGGNTSWNIGIGAVMDQDVTVLGDGIVPNQALPAGEDAAIVRSKTTDEWGWLIVTSFAF